MLPTLADPERSGHHTLNIENPRNIVLSDGLIAIVDGNYLEADLNIVFRQGPLTSLEQSVVSQGFHTHSEERSAPEYKKERVKWLAVDERDDMRAALTAEILWDWIYIDELWISRKLRGEGLGRRLMQLAEDFALSRNLRGIWLWTQSWQAEGFYRQLGYTQFTRFDDFPKGHSRIGFRKILTNNGEPKS